MQNLKEFQTPCGNSPLSGMITDQLNFCNVDKHSNRSCFYVNNGTATLWIRDQIINNFWMRLSMISWIIKTEVCIICRSRRLRQITQTRGFDNLWYHAKTEFNNCFIIHFSHNSSSETEAKRNSAIFVSENTPRGLVTRQTLNLTW